MPILDKPDLIVKVKNSMTSYLCPNCSTKLELFDLRFDGCIWDRNNGMCCECFEVYDCSNMAGDMELPRPSSWDKNLRIKLTIWNVISKKEGTIKRFLTAFTMTETLTPPLPSPKRRGRKRITLAMIAN
ncbi:MAG: hypothetical protein A2Z27_05400 [candidate division Zixibacteria bacterium RBG_16_50_21]|nr:MAG: hypothetical protein A2Z27_05400 [candidate division Zixibacteria bacterium RBG_16_50_21]